MAQLEPFVYFGTSQFSRLVLEGLLRANIKPRLVVTVAAKPAGRGLQVARSLVADAAHATGLPLLEVTSLKSPDIQAQLAASTTRFAILAAFGKIIPAAVLKLYPSGIINVHPSLLPRYRGPSPLQYALRDGVSETGVSLIVLDEEVDHGPILAQQADAVLPEDDAAALGARLAGRAVAILLDSLPRYLAGELKPQPQPHGQATFTKMITREDGRANWQHGSDTLARQSRAFAPWPGLWTMWRHKRLKLVEVEAVPGSVVGHGRVAVNGSDVIIGCAPGALSLKKVQLEGGKPLAIEDFLRGHQDFIGTQL